MGNLPQPAPSVDVCEDRVHWALLPLLDVVPRMWHLMLHLIQGFPRCDVSQLSFNFTYPLVMMFYLHSQLQPDFKLVICPASIPICPWVPSSLGANAPMSAATIVLTSVDSCTAGAAGVIVLQRACTATTAVVVDLSVCSRGSPVHCFLDSVELAELSGSDLPLQGSSCSHRSNADSGSGRVGEHKITCPVVPH